MTNKCSIEFTKAILNYLTFRKYEYLQVPGI